MRIGWVMMLHTTCRMDQYQITSTNKYGVFEPTSSMGVSQETIWIIDIIDPTLLDMQILQDLLSIGNSTSITISTKTIIHGLTNKIIVYLQKTSTHPGLYSSNNTVKYFSTNQIY